MKKTRLTAFAVLVVLLLTLLMPGLALAEGEDVCEHVPGEAVITPATFTEDGSVTTSCTICEEELTRDVIPMASAKLAKTAYTYTGSVIQPAVTVADNAGNELAAENYTVVYEDEASKLPGKYGVTVTLQGERYSGETTLTYKIGPAKVTGLKYSVSSTTSVKLSWSKTAGADKYEVYNSTTKKKVATVTGTSATISKLTVGKSYSLKVRAYDKESGRYGSYSSAITVNTLKSAIKSIDATSSSVKLNWSKVSGASGYYVYRRSSASGAWKKIATIKSASTTSYTVKTTGTYYYSIAAYRTSGGKTTTALKSSAVRSRALNTPKAKAAITDDSTIVKVSWKKISGATGYVIQRRAADKNGKWTAGSWTTVATVGDVASYKANNGHGKYYHYRVRAIYKNNGVTTYGQYSAATQSWITYFYPNISFFMSKNSNSSCSAVAIQVENLGKSTMRIYSSGARLIDRDYATFNRNVYLFDTSTAKKLSYVDIKPGEKKMLCFAVNGSRTWYDSKSRIDCNFRCDGVDYSCYFSYNYGFYWINEFQMAGHQNVFGYGLA